MISIYSSIYLKGREVNSEGKAFYEERIQGKKGKFSIN